VRPACFGGSGGFVAFAERFPRVKMQRGNTPRRPQEARRGEQTFDWGSHPTPPFLVYRTSPPEAHMIEQFYTVTEIASLLKCHPETVRRLCDRGELRSIRVATNRRIPESAVTEYMDGAQNVVNFKRKAS
jgi:excisionase family DNA binding protein